MHPVLTMREWYHAHHADHRPETTHWLARWTHDYRLWTVVALVLYLAIVISLVLLAGHEKVPLTITQPMYPFYQF